MPTKPQQTDLVTKARELLRRASFEGYSVFPWKVVDTDVVDADGQVLLKIWNGYHNGELAAAAPELLRQLADEVERLRSDLKTAELTVEGLLDRIGVRNDD